MGDNANCSEMVTTLLTIVLFVFQLALSGIFNGRTVHYEIQIGLWAFKTFLALQTYITSIVITTMN